MASLTGTLTDDAWDFEALILNDLPFVSYYPAAAAAPVVATVFLRTEYLRSLRIRHLR